jgi:hypothetical protein
VRIRVAVVLLLLAGPRGLGADGADSHEAILKESIAVLNCMADVLEGIKDRGGAKAARPKLEKAVARLVDLKRREGKLEKITPEEDWRLQKAYAADKKKIQERFFQVGKQLAMNGAFEEVKDIFAKMQRLDKQQ